jgi:hypothetical protein
MIRGKVKKIKREIKRRTGVLPDYIIIGAMKCGTTSMYNYLVQHPNVRQAAKKEVHFFDWEYQKGLTFYRSQFPTRIYKEGMRIFRNHHFLCGEASPYYLFHPHVARRVAHDLPDVKLIAILRNPVDRAYSHYWHWKRENIEQLSFEEAVKSEPERLAGELDKMLKDEFYESYNYGYYSYLARGLYYEQLKKWRSYFPEEQFIVIGFEEFHTKPLEIYKRVTRFLNLPDWELCSFRSHNAGKYPEMAKEIRDTLNAYFAPHNQLLYDYLGVDFGWNK